MVEGLSPGTHAIHVHETADFSNDCSSAGGHFNPTDGVVASEAEDIEDREVGDLGTIEADEDGVAIIEIEDPLAMLFGEHDITGRSIVIHGTAEDSTVRVACGEILAKENYT